MKLEDYAHIATIVSGVSTVILLAISTGVAYFVYRWHRESSLVINHRQIQEDLRHYNFLVLENKDLQKLEGQRHRWGKLDEDDVVKMYHYFIMLNISYSAYECMKRKAISKPVYESKINNTANLTFIDREFILQHVFPRGYENGFKKEITDRWRKIENSGTLNGE